MLMLKICENKGDATKLNECTVRVERPTLTDRIGCVQARRRVGVALSNNCKGTAGPAQEVVGKLREMSACECGKERERRCD